MSNKQLFEKFGFEEDSEFNGLFSHPQIGGMIFAVEDGFISIYTGELTEYKISYRRIPFIESSLVNLLKAFCV